MEKNLMMILGIAAVVVLVVAGFTLLNNEGTSETNTDGANEGSSVSDGSNDGSNQANNIVGNWTFVSGVQSGQPVTHIVSGWVNYKADGTWVYFFDYGYTTVDAEGTWQAQDGELYWGTNGNEVSDWYSYDSYQFVDGDLVITSDNSEMIYRRV